MKRLLVGLALFAAACSGQSPSAPSGTSTSAIGVQAPASPASGSGASVPTVDPTPGGPSNTATVPQFTFNGPRSPQNCFTAGTDPMQWVLNVTDAGPRALHLIALAHQDDTPGCEATAKNPRSRVVVTGVTDYTPHSVGQTTFTFDPKMYNCGRVQVDVSIFDSNGNEILVLGTVINYGSQCTPPPPNSLVCAPSAQNGLINTPFAFTATGGNGTYSWSSPSGTPLSGAGASYTTQYTNAGGYVVTVTSNGQSATCQVQVQGTVVIAPFCTPATQTVGLGAPATITAGGGNGVYSWSAPGGATASGTGSSFTTTYATAGTHTVTLTSSGLTTTCTVITPPEPPPLVCAPPQQTVAIGVPATATATGGTGTYSWAAPGGTVATGGGTNFTTSYPASGSYTMTVTSGTQTAQCNVTVPPVEPPLVCAPPSQTAAIGQIAPMSATGGNGTYSWSAPGGSTTTGTGAAFSTSYNAAGTYTATVTSGSQSQQCTVTVPPPTQTLACTPPTQTATIGSPVNFQTVGNATGPFTWTATGSNTPTGNGTTFTTAYAAPGSYSVTVTNGTITSQPCVVTIPQPTPLVCTPASQNSLIGAIVNMSATGGTGSYTWSAPGGSTTTGSGATFGTSYPAAGFYTATVTSGGQTAQCTVAIPVNSCAGTTVTALDLLAPTAGIQVNVPTGQVANIRAVVSDRRQSTVTEYTYPNIGSTVLQVPIPCFPKVIMFCDQQLLEQFEGPDQCPVP